MPRSAFLFPGQGAQSVGMAGGLAALFPPAKALFDRAAELLGYDLLHVCVNGPAERLNATDVSQPAIYVASLAALEHYRSTDPAAFDDVTDTAGLSLGEYTALTFAGALSFEDGLKVVQARGRAMQAAAEATPSGMASVIGLEADEVEEIVSEIQAARPGETLRVANLLCPGNTAVSGTLPALAALNAVAETRGLRVVSLAVAGAFHTDLMRPADEALAAALDAVTLNPPRLPVWSNVDGLPHTDPAEIRQLLVRQVVSPVLWEATMRGMLDAGVEGFAEIGPGRVLAGLLKRVSRKVPVANVGA